MLTVSVEISRIHKGAPYNCAFYLPDLQVEDFEKAIDHPVVEEAINKTFGKKLVVNLHLFGKMASPHWLCYEVEKPKAIL
ncbi:MAG: hypothetical protein HOP30_11205 [Cyclobacteriaceae bacterium]|nr:hypothetical protein [Cyclobacteriaceae bacterium]